MLCPQVPVQQLTLQLPDLLQLQADPDELRVAPPRQTQQAQTCSTPQDKQHQFAHLSASVSTQRLLGQETLTTVLLKFGLLLPSYKAQMLPLLEALQSSPWPVQVQPLQGCSHHCAPPPVRPLQVQRLQEVLVISPDVMSPQQCPTRLQDTLKEVGMC